MAQVKSTTSPRLDLLSEVAPGELKVIRRGSRVVSYEKGSLLYSPEEKARNFFVLKQGRVQLYRLSPQGRKIVLADLHPVTYLGEACPLGLEAHETFAEAVEDTVVCKFHRSEILELMQRLPNISLRLARVLDERLRHMEGRLEGMAFNAVDDRLANVLLQLPRDERGQIVGYSQNDLANLIGSYRETTNKALNNLAKIGCLGLGRKKIVILDEPQLRQKARVN